MNCSICNKDGKNATGYVLVRPYGSSTIMFYAVRCPGGCDHGKVDIKNNEQFVAALLRKKQIGEGWAWESAY